MNCKPLKFFVAAILSITFYCHSFAQDATGLQADSTYALDDEDSTGNLPETPGDTEIVKTAFDAGNDSVQRWKKSKDFAYLMYLDSLLMKEKDLRMDTVSIDKATGKKRRTRLSTKSNPASFLNSVPLQIFFWALALFFIGFIIYKLFLTNGIFAKRNTRIAEEKTESDPEGLNEYAEYDNLVREAENKNDYNLSTRYLYLQTLKKLADRDLIMYAPDKTNYSYVNELTGQNYKQEFATLTLNYEYVWYGKFIISRDHYEQLKGQFYLFNKKI